MHLQAICRQAFPKQIIKIQCRPKREDANRCLALHVALIRVVFTKVRIYVAERISILSVRMETEVLSRKDLGGSLPVENVQALASNNLKEIPPRYIRPEIEHEEVSMDDSLQIPVVDMSKLIGDPLGHGDELAKLHLACKDWGFFQVLVAVF